MNIVGLQYFAAIIIIINVAIPDRLSDEFEPLGCIGVDVCCVCCQWGAKALRNMLIVPPGSGIVHQVNLEYLARAVFIENGLLYPDSLVGTDSHTTMINGLGVVGWGT